MANPTNPEDEEEEEDDYLSMTFPDSTTSRTNNSETSLQRTARLKKEAAARSQPLSKASLAERERLARETGLSTRLDISNNKGAQMLARLGYQGGALGRSPDARTLPIELAMKGDRGGVGLDAERKRKIREVAAEQEEENGKGEKKKKIDEEEFRERNRREREEKRAEGQMWGAMKVLEGFEESDVGDDASGVDESTRKPQQHRVPQLRDVNVLYRSLVKQRLVHERERKMRRDLNNSLSTHTDHDEEDDDGDGQGEFKDFDNRVDELDDEDEELQHFEGLNLAERRDKIVHELRSKYHYCFWCKFQYEDERMEGCPGLTEDEHG